jgi:hypothetical protein
MRRCRRSERAAASPEWLNGIAGPNRTARPGPPAPVRGRFQSDVPWRCTYANVPPGETAILHPALVFFSFPFCRLRTPSLVGERACRSNDRSPSSPDLFASNGERGAGPAQSVVCGGDELLRSAQYRHGRDVPGALMEREKIFSGSSHVPTEYV